MKRWGDGDDGDVCAGVDVDDDVDDDADDDVELNDDDDQKKIQQQYIKHTEKLLKSGHKMQCKHLPNKGSNQTAVSCRWWRQMQSASTLSSFACNYLQNNTITNTRKHSESVEAVRAQSTSAVPLQPNN